MIATRATYNFLQKHHYWYQVIAGQITLLLWSYVMSYRIILIASLFTIRRTEFKTLKNGQVSSRFVCNSSIRLHVVRLHSYPN